MLTFLWCQPPNIIFYYGSSSRFAWAERLKNSLNNSLRWPRKISLSTLPSCWKGFFGEGSKASLTWWPLPSGPIIFSSQGLEVETGWQGQLQWLRHCGTDFSLLCSKHASNPTFYLCIPLVGITGLQNPYDNQPLSISMQKSFFFPHYSVGDHPQFFLKLSWDKSFLIQLFLCNNIYMRNHFWRLEHIEYSTQCFMCIIFSPPQHF